MLLDVFRPMHKERMTPRFQMAETSQAGGKTVCPLQSPSSVCSCEAVAVSSVWSGGQEELPA